jgi:hypothetical protein
MIATSVGCRPVTPSKRVFWRTDPGSHRPGERSGFPTSYPRNLGIAATYILCPGAGK